MNIQVGSQVSDAFDSIAEVFDSALENDITRRLRAKIYSIVDSYVKPEAAVLDINCGTGIDAIHFHEQGYHVTGIDISPNMIAVARDKAAKNHGDQPRFFVSSYDDLSSLSLSPADLVFSNFGGLNCAADLDSVARSIGGATKPGGYFIGVLMPPFSVWEFFSYAVRFRMSNALRRFRSRTPASGFNGRTFPVYYYSPGAVADAFSEDFIARKIIGLSVFSPTPQSTGFLRKHPGLSRKLSRLDDLIGELPFICSAGDHYIIVLEKRP